MSWGEACRGSEQIFNTIASLVDGGAVIWCGTSTGAAGDYQLSPYPRDPDTLLIDEYESGLRYQFIAHQDSAGSDEAALYTAPHNPRLLAFKPIVNWDGSALAAGQIQAGGAATLVDIGSSFLLIDAGTSGSLSPIVVAGNGLVTKTGTNAYTTRTITSSSTSLTVTDGNGVAGNPTLALDGDLQAIGQITGSGILARTAVSSWSLRTITAGNADLTITNGNGVSGNPTIETSATQRSGWVAVSSAWSYASATTVTVPTDATTIYSKGMKVRFKQGGGYKYYIITAVAATTLTLNGGSDYTVANSAITEIYYSEADAPLDFPDWFNYSPTVTGFSSNPTNTAYKFRTSGRKCEVLVRQATAGTSNSIYFTITAPITAATVANARWGVCWWEGVDNGAYLTTPGAAYIDSAGTAITVEKTIQPGGTAWTSANGKSANFILEYEF